MTEFNASTVEFAAALQQSLLSVGAAEVVEQLVMTAEDQGVEDADETLGVEGVLTFEDAGLLTSNNGLVVRLTNGQEFQLTVVQSR